MKRWLAALASLALSGCFTSQRLWRITPFEGGAGERVNLWPLAYHQGNETSILWPFFDVDEKGFALRPLIAKDGHAYSILYPLAAFDTEADVGWATLFYRTPNNQGLFPIANLGRFNYVGPVWWKEGRGGLFPLAYFGDWNYVGPVWWREGAAGLFPIAGFGTANYVGPAWWGGGGYGLFPLFGKQLFGSDIDHVGPVWWRKPPDERAEFGLWPLVSYGDGGREFTLLPLYSHDRDAERTSTNVLLGLGHWGTSGERRERWLLPLYFQRSEPLASDTVLLPFYWKRTRGEAAEVYTLLGNRTVDPESRTLNLYPLWWSSESPRTDVGWRLLFPFFYWSHAKDERTLITPLGGRGWSTSGEPAFVNVLGPIYHHSESRRRDEELTAFLWPLFEKRRAGTETTTRLAGLYDTRSGPESSETTYLFGLGHGERTSSGLSHRFWPLYSWSNDEETPGPLYWLTLFGFTDHAGVTRTRLFPLFSKERSSDGAEWNALLGLAHHDAHGEESRSWLWPLYARAAGGSGSEGVTHTTLVGSSEWEGGTHFQLGASLVFSRWREESAARSSSTSRALVLFTHEEEESHLARVPAAEAMHRSNRVAYESTGFLFDAFVNETSRYRAWEPGAVSDEEARVLRAYHSPASGGAPPEPSRVRAILEAKGAVVADDAPATLRAALEAFASDHSRTLERRHVRLPLLYGYERTPDELSWIGPLGLASYGRDAAGERRSFLYYGYRSETKGEHTSRDIFPFITWDSGPDETEWSFLWRFLHYERKGVRRGGHVLFFPWGEL